jgi:3-hydroxyacyl-[acyl-carrier-protein] dehydratase
MTGFAILHPSYGVTGVCNHFHLIKKMMMNETKQGIFHFDSNDPIYADHFPGQPVVPGSLIVWAFTQALEKSGYVLETVKLGPFRFRRFIGPGSYRYSLVPSDSGIKCVLYDNNKTVAEGVVLI